MAAKIATGKSSRQRQSGIGIVARLKNAHAAGINDSDFIRGFSASHRIKAL